MTSAEEIKSGDEELEEEDTDAGLDDSMLDEIADGADESDDTEGFGHLKDDEEEDEEEDSEEALEEDAEDVDYDSFDDEDHL